MKAIKFNCLQYSIVCGLLLMCLPVKAQWAVGLQAGYTHNSLTTSSGYFYDRVYYPQGGLTIGIPVNYAFTEWFSLGAEAAFVQKSYDARRSGYFDILHEKVQNNYFSMPVYVNFSFGGTRLRGFMNVGAYWGTWLSSYRNGAIYCNFTDKTPDYVLGIEDENHIYYYDEKLDFDSRRDNRFEAGAMLGAGISYFISSNIKIFGECRYYYSLTDMQKNYMKKQVPRYNNTFAFQAGFMFLFNK